MKRIKKAKDETGGSMVEFALISPLLFLILFGIIEFGLLLFDKAVLTNACREGARAGIVFSDPRPSSDEIKQVVVDYCRGYLISFSADSSLGADDVTVSLGAESGDSLTVNVAYPYQFLVFAGLSRLFGDGINGTINLSAESVMRLE